MNRISSGASRRQMTSEVKGRTLVARRRVLPQGSRGTNARNSDAAARVMMRETVKPVAYTPTQIASQIGSFVLVCAYLLSLCYAHVLDEEAVAEIRYLPVLLVVVVGLFSVLVHSTMRHTQRIAALNRTLLVPQALVLLSLGMSTGFFYVVSGSSWTPLFYAIGLSAHMVFQNQIFHLSDVSTLRSAMKVVFISVLVSVVAFPGVDYNGYVSGVFRTGNALGIVMCCLLYILFACWPGKKLTLAIGSGLILYIIFLTSSRSALAFAITFFILHFASIRRDTFRAAIAGLITFTGVYLAYMSQLEEAFPDYMFGAKSLFSGAAGREDIWRLSLDIIGGYPLGVGLGNSESVMGPIAFHSASHNALLKMTLEGGWLFGMSYVLLLVVMLKRSRSSLTQVVLISLNVKYLFEIATPFGLSLSSAILTLPYFIEDGLCRRKSSGY